MIVSRCAARKKVSERVKIELCMRGFRDHEPELNTYRVTECMPKHPHNRRHTCSCVIFVVLLVWFMIIDYILPNLHKNEMFTIAHIYLVNGNGYVEIEFMPHITLFSYSLSMYFGCGAFFCEFSLLIAL